MIGGDATKNRDSISLSSSELWRLFIWLWCSVSSSTTFMLIARTNRYKLVIHAFFSKPLVITIRPKIPSAAGILQVRVQASAGDLYIDKHDPLVLSIMETLDKDVSCENNFLLSRWSVSENKTIIKIKTDLPAHFSKSWSSWNSPSHCLKITQNVAFEFLNFGIFQQFLTY